METISKNPPINFTEEGKWLSAVKRFETPSLVFDKTVDNNSFSCFTRNHWTPKDGGETVSGLKKLLELRRRIDFEKHLQEDKKRCLILAKDFSLANHDTNQKKEIVEQLKGINYNDLKNVVFIMKLTYNEVRDILDIKNFGAKTTSYTILPGRNMNSVTSNWC